MLLACTATEGVCKCMYVCVSVCYCSLLSLWCHLFMLLLPLRLARLALPRLANCLCATAAESKRMRKPRTDADADVLRAHAIAKSRHFKRRWAAA